MCTSFENNVSEVLVDHTITIAKERNLSKVVLAGGVSANRKLRELLVEEGKKENIQIFLPELKYCTDNASMVASCAYFNPIKCDDSLMLEVFSRG